MGDAAGDNGNGHRRRWRSNSDGYDDIVIGAKHESTAASKRVAYVIYGRSAGDAAATVDTDGAMSLADADIMLTGELEDDKAGRQVAIIPDVNGDGGAELLVASPGADYGGAQFAGTVYVLFGGGTSGSLADADVILKGTTGYNYTGFGLNGGDLVASAEDTNDILIGAVGNDVGGPNTGTIWIVPGEDAIGEIEVEEMTNYVTGQAENDAIGGSFDVLDVNGDGQDDLVIGSPDSSEGSTNAGTVHVVFGPISEPTVWQTPTFNTRENRHPIALFLTRYGRRYQRRWIPRLDCWRPIR